MRECTILSIPILEIILTKECKDRLLDFGPIRRGVGVIASRRRVRKNLSVAHFHSPFSLVRLLGCRVVLAKFGSRPLQIAVIERKPYGEADEGEGD